MCEPASKRTKFSTSEHCVKFEEKCPCKCSTHLFGSNQIPRKKKNYCTNSRLQHLSTPKLTTKKFKENSVYRYGRCIEIVREDKIPTRIKMLAFPKVRKLISNRNDHKDHIPKYRYDKFNKLIKKSMFSMYSRLGNAQVPPQKEKPQPWSSDDWNRHNEWLRLRAQPKKEIEIVPKKSERVPLVDLLETMENLSKPNPRKVRQKHVFDPYKIHRPVVKTEVKIKKIPFIKGFFRNRAPVKEEEKKAREPIKPTTNQFILNLATPKNPRGQKGPTPPSSDTDLRLKRLKPTARQIAYAEKLYLARKPQQTEPDAPNPISVFALKAKPTPKTITLAMPREREVEDEVTLPLKISKAALKAKIKPRTLELTIPSKYKPPSIKFAKTPVEDLYAVKPTAKYYIASENILKISKPKLPITSKFEEANE